MSFWKEFKTFAIRGNMVDLAIGIMIGAAFGKVVSSLVSDVLMPPIGLLLGGLDFSSLAITLKAAAAGQEPVQIKYGLFISGVIDFLIISLVIFFIIKLMNRLRKEEPAEATTKECPQCLMNIPLAAKKCGHCCSNV
jgi:large conductance mechanosensitive channel